MEGHQDSASEEWDAKVGPIIKKALEEGRIPIECIEYVEYDDMFMAKVVVYKEC